MPSVLKRFNAPPLTAFPTPQSPILPLCRVYRNSGGVAISSFFGVRKMLQREALAGALRAIRSLRGLHYGDLARSTSKSQLGDLETGKRTVTLDKLADLADALNIELTALVALTISIQRGEPCELTLARASSALLDFYEAGGHELVAEHYIDGRLQTRSTGKPKRTKDLEAVKAMKAAGLTQADAVGQLGLAKTTVHRYWK